VTPASAVDDLPEGWDTTTLGDVADLNPPKPVAHLLPPHALITFVPMPAVDAGAGVITGATARAFGEVRSGYTAFRDGDVLFAKITPCMENGKAAIARGLNNMLGFGSSEFHVLRPSAAVLAEYLFYFIRQEGFRREAEEHMTGSVGQKRVPATYVRDVEIPFCPLTEQRRIVVKVEELLAQVNQVRERLARAPAILKRFRQSVLSAAYEGRLTQGWRESRANSKPVGPQGGPDGGLPRLPHAWAWLSPDQISAPVSNALTIGPFGSSLLASEYQPAGVPLVLVREIRSGVFIGPLTKYVTIEKARQLAAHKVRGGDVLITKMGDPPGDATIYPKGMADAIATSDCIKLTPNEQITSAKYVMHAIRSRSVARQIVQITKGVAQQKVSLARFRTIGVPMAPIPEQREIVRRVEALFKLADDIEKQVGAATKRVDKLTQAILAKAFRGELVPTEAELARKQGRSYEPASALLERIRNEREAKTESPARASVRRRKQL
jgi:type I restriction enzyme, S subunit